MKKYLIKLSAVSLLLNQFSGYGLLAQAQLSEINQETEVVEEENQTESDSLENELDNSSSEEDLIGEDSEIENNLSDIESDENITQEDLEKEENEIENNSSQNELDESLIQEDVTKEEVELGDSTILNSEIAISEEVESRGVGSGLVQLWQVVPSNQTAEGKTTSQIMSSLQCRPNHNLYANNGKTEHGTYVNSCYVDDALYLGEDSSYYYIYLSGFEGKVPKSQSHYYELDLNNDGKKVKYEIQTVAYYIPASQTKSKNSDSIHTQAPFLNYETDYLKQYTDLSEQELSSRSTATVQSPSYYANDNGVLVHYLTNNVKVANNYSKVIVGKAPSWMKSGQKYYSYDGVYFYTNWQNIRVNGSGAINQNNPFYNYYQYLPFRSTTNYNTTVLDKYTESNGYTEFPTTTTLSSKQSMLVGAGKYFINAQKNFGTNAALQYAMGVHESGWGRSSISVTKNNLFGMNATDSNPYGDATTFYSVEDGIFYHADRYISWGYTDPVGDYRYFGSHVGNKGSGMNVKYASDPFWGEKIAGWYYRLDSASGLKDYNYYSIGIKQSNSVYNVRSEANTSSTVLYTTKNAKSNIKLINYPVLLVGENGNFYQIKTDTPIVDNRPIYSATYKWDENYAYISKDAIYLANDAMYNDPKINVCEIKFFDTFTVNSISADSEKLTGMGLPGATVKAYVNNKEVGSTKVGTDGKYSLILPEKQKGGTEVVVKMSMSGYETISKTQKVLHIFNTFTIGTINTNTTKFTGTGVSGATVKAYVNNKEVGSTKVGTDGKYSLTLSAKQKGGTEVVVKMSMSGYETISKTQKVLHVFDTFTIGTITKDTTKFTGTGLSGATVKAYVNNKEVGSTKVGTDGKYSLSLSAKQKGGTEIVVKMSMNGYQTISKTQKVLHVFNTFTIGTITKDTTKFTGTGLSGATVKAYVNNKEIGSTKVGTDGKYSLSLSAKQKGGTEIVVKMSMSGYQTISKTQKVLHVFNTFTIGTITTNTTKFTGTGLSGATVKAYINNKEVAKATVGSNGKYTLTLSKKQKAGTEIVVKMSKSGYQTISKTQKVLKVFDKFTVGSIATNTTKFTGTGLSGATVKAYINNKEVAKATVGSNGKYTLTLSKKQKAGTEIVVKMSKSGYQTISKTQKVLKVFDKFTVGSIATNTTKFTGTGLSGATVKAYINNKEVAKATVGSNGKYTLTLSKKQKAGTEIVVKMSRSGYQTISKTQKVVKVFSTFTVNKIKSTSAKFTGTGLSGATVKAYINNKEVAKATVGSNGKYTLTLSKKQKAGTEIVVKMSKSGYKTTSKTVKVIKG